VMVVPNRLVPTITRLIAKAGQREQSIPRRPNPYQGSGVKRADGCIARRRGGCPCNKR
jgi:hypothetical protein